MDWTSGEDGDNEEAEEEEEEDDNEEGEQAQPAGDHVEEAQPAEVVWMGPYKSAGYYRNTNCFGIKTKAGRQVFSFGGRHSKLNEQGLRNLGVLVLQKLNNKEMGPGAAAIWAKKQC